MIAEDETSIKLKEEQLICFAEFGVPAIFLHLLCCYFPLDCADILDSDWLPSNQQEVEGHLQPICLSAASLVPAVVQSTPPCALFLSPVTILMFPGLPEISASKLITQN